MIRAQLDRDGVLVGADTPLLALNARAGGTIGSPLAIAPVATLARLAVRLGVLIARGVTVADEQTDLDLWVRVEPETEGVALSIADWRESRPWRPTFADAATDAPASLDPTAMRWEADAAMRLIAFSAGGEERFGADPAAALGRPFTQFVRLTEDVDGGLPILKAITQRHDFAAQRAQIRASGRAVLLAGSPRFDRGGAFAGFTGTIMPDPAASGEASAEGFGSRLDVVLRPPVGRIVTIADAIHAQADGPLRADYVEYAADIASAGRHLLSLIDDLSDLRAIERPDFVVAVEQIDLADVARRAAGLLGVRAADGGVTTHRPAAPDALPAPGKFRRALQVLVNLVGNAVHYSPRGGTVRVRADRDADLAVVVVADRGKGIAAVDQERIFDKFERVDGADPGGSGIGLYIARRLARAMGGDVTVDSAPGQGARFTFSLPAAVASAS